MHTYGAGSVCALNVWWNVPSIVTAAVPDDSGVPGVPVGILTMSC